MNLEKNVQSNRKNNNNKKNKHTNNNQTVQGKCQSDMKDPVLCRLYVSHLIPIVGNDLNYILPTELRLGCSFSCTENLRFN